MVKKHFPRHHRYFKIFNPNTMKLSYSCMPNVGNIIKQHNARTLQPEQLNQYDPCNCDNPEACPLDGDCNSIDTVYKATVESDSTGDPENPMRSVSPSENVYFGIAAGLFKPRYRNHIKSFNNRNYETESKLSEFIWKLKGKGIRYTIKWKIVTNTQVWYNRCNLCLTEKVVIARCNHRGLLNKRTELLNKCRHRNKFMLSKC